MRKNLAALRHLLPALHFTDELLQKLQEKGIRRAEVTLHVGLGTFRPVKVDDITKHHMHTEWYSVPEETAALIRETKENGNRVICVGTTSCRTLESVYKKYHEIKACHGETDIFYVSRFFVWGNGRLDYKFPSA